MGNATNFVLEVISWRTLREDQSVHSFFHSNRLPRCQNFRMTTKENWWELWKVHVDNSFFLFFNVVRIGMDAKPYNIQFYWFSFCTIWHPCQFLLLSFEFQIHLIDFSTFSVYWLFSYNKFSDRKISEIKLKF